MPTIKEVKQYAVELVAEFFATTVLIFIGESGIANYKFGRLSSYANLAVAITFGVGVYSALMIAGPITGAHLNPAVSISLFTIGKLKPLQCIFYIIGQVAGAFFGAFLVYAIFWDMFNEFDGGIRQIVGSNGTADIFFTMPSNGVSYWTSCLDQTLTTALLLIFIMALSADYNHMVSESGKPFAFVLFVAIITLSFSNISGAAINPARDFGPRLFAALVFGWNQVFQANNYFFWIPIVCPISGGILGTWIYQGYIWLIKNHGPPSFTENNSANSDGFKMAHPTDGESKERRQNSIPILH